MATTEFDRHSLPSSPSGHGQYDTSPALAPTDGIRLVPLPSQSASPYSSSFARPTSTAKLSHRQPSPTGFEDPEHRHRNDHSGPVSVLRHLPHPPPPPPPPRASTGRLLPTTISHPPPPPPPPLLQPSPQTGRPMLRDVQSHHQHLPRRASPGSQLPALPHFPPPVPAYLPPRDAERYRRNSSPSISIWSGSWQHKSTGSGSEVSSDVSEDFFDRQNQAAFPPLLPTVQSYGSTERQRRQITHVITRRVALLEQNRTSVPSLASGASSAASTASSNDDPVAQLWTQLKERRHRLIDIKQEMAGRRRALREVRRRKDEADNSFMNMLRPILLRNRRGALGPIDEALDTRFAEMQSLRTEYHWLESGYEGLEISLDDEEAELNNIETRFFSLLAAGTAGTARPSRTSHDPDNGEMYDPNVPDDLRGISRNGPADDAHPLWHDLVSAIADLNNAKDEYDDLLRIHEQMQYDIDMKDALGQELTSEEIEFMDEYPDDENEKKETLEHCTREVARLKELCERKGAMKKHPSFRLLYAIDPNVGEDMSLDELPPAPPTLAHWVFPDLMSSPDHVLRPAPLTALRELKEAALLPDDDPGRRSRLAAAQKEYGISTLIRESKEEDKSDFITRWLLHHLRTHPLAAEFLYTMFVDYFRSLRLKIDNIRLWQQDVLYYWWRDAAVRSSEAFLGPLTASGMSPPAYEARLVQASVPVDVSPPSSVASGGSSGRAGFASDAQSLIF